MFTIIRFLHCLNKASKKTDRPLTINRSCQAVPSHAQNGDIPVSLSEFESELSAILNQIANDGYISFEDAENFRLTYNGIHYIKHLMALLLKPFLLSVVLPLLVTILANYLM